MIIFTPAALNIYMKFNLFGTKDGKLRPAFIDKTYMTTRAKMKACSNYALEDPKAIFITWFAESTKQFKEFFINENINPDRIIEYKYIHTEKLAGYNAIFAEHYPLRTKEVALVENWDQKKIFVYSGLDEPLFKYYGGEKIRYLMTKMGVDETEAIEHPLISKSIFNIQEKTGKKIISEQFASSQEEWFNKNLK